MHLSLRLLKTWIVSMIWLPQSLGENFLQLKLTRLPNISLQVIIKARTQYFASSVQKIKQFNQLNNNTIII